VSQGDAGLEAKGADTVRNATSGPGMGSLLIALLVSRTQLQAQDLLDQLDRGHRILIQRGLQIHAHVLANDDWADDAWKRSTFTAPDLWGGRPMAPGDPWGMGGTSISLDDPYLPGLISWAYKDEQDISDPAQVAEAKAWIEAYRPYLPNTILHTNQGSRATLDDMRYYMREVQPDMARCDAYPWQYDPLCLYYKTYANMSMYRTLGLEGNDGTGTTPIPYGIRGQTFRSASIETNEDSGPYWMPSESQMRLNMFAAWTFGFTHYATWIYNDVFDGNGQYLDSPFFDDGLYGSFQTTLYPTEALARYAELNRQSLNLGDTLVRLISTDVRIVPDSRGRNALQWS
jgi:hypothetical protein